MKWIQSLGIAVILCVASLPAFASDFTGVYARVDKVVLEPGSGTPERIQVWGVFSLAKPGGPSEYYPPARGYLYLHVDRNPEAARNEWNDLKQAAGAGEIVAFGLRGQTPRVRKAEEKPEKSDPYVLNVGVAKVRSRTDYPPVRSLLDFKD